VTAAPGLAPGATLGVLGGGQLGRMFVHAAQRLGYRCIVLDPDRDSPAGRVAERHLQADYLDADALDALAREAAAVTTEFENVPARALRRLAAQVLDTIVAVCLVQVQDAFGIAAGAEGMPAPGEIGKQIGEVVRFPVEDDPQ